MTADYIDTTHVKELFLLNFNYIFIFLSNGFCDVKVLNAFKVHHKFLSDKIQVRLLSPSQHKSHEFLEVFLQQI